MVILIRSGTLLYFEFGQFCFYHINLNFRTLVQLLLDKIISTTHYMYATNQQNTIFTQ